MREDSLQDLGHWKGEGFSRVYPTVIFGRLLGTVQPLWMFGTRNRNFGSFFSVDEGGC